MIKYKYIVLGSYVLLCKKFTTGFGEFLEVCFKLHKTASDKSSYYLSREIKHTDSKGIPY